jgi:hypothetical protein
MNAAGYRFAASDQAFYIPAVVRHLDPSLFPRDAPLIDSQARLTVIDEIVAALIGATGLSLQHLFLGLYVIALTLLLGAAARLGARMYRTGWAVAALGAALTLRHALAKTGANTLEGYFHPRQLAFALGLWAVACFMERRERTALALLIGAAAVHSTTAFWFIAWIAGAAFIGRPQWRRAMIVGLAIAGTAGALALWRGPLAGHLTVMDADWLAAVGEKDLFPLAWPIDAWLTNLVAVPVILLCWRARHRAGLTVPGETPVALGAMILVLLFACWLPFNVAHVALAVQMQVARVFWPLDVFATIYLVWWIAEGAKGAEDAQGADGGNGAGGAWRARRAAIAIVLFALVRGLYSLYVQFPERRIFAVDVQHDDWRDAMAFARSTDPRSGWLADPVHAAKYGSSLRAAGQRDVLVEALKDRAIAMYDRGIAMRVADRLRALESLPWDTPDGARALSRRYGLDYLIVDRNIELPLAHRSGSLYIYRLR